MASQEGQCDYHATIRENFQNYKAAVVKYTLSEGTVHISDGEITRHCRPVLC